MRDESTVVEQHSPPGLAYSANGKVHFVASDEVKFSSDGERYSALCGALFPKKVHPANPLRIADEYQKGMFCETCITRLKERGATVPGLMEDGEVKARV